MLPSLGHAWLGRSSLPEGASAALRSSSGDTVWMYSLTLSTEFIIVSTPITIMIKNIIIWDIWLLYVRPTPASPALCLTPRCSDMTA